MSEKSFSTSFDDNEEILNGIWSVDVRYSNPLKCRMERSGGFDAVANSFSKSSMCLRKACIWLLLTNCKVNGVIPYLDEIIRNFLKVLGHHDRWLPGKCAEQRRVESRSDMTLCIRHSDWLSAVLVESLLDLLAGGTQCQENSEVMWERGGRFEDEGFGHGLRLWDIICPRFRWRCCWIY